MKVNNFGEGFSIEVNESRGFEIPFYYLSGASLILEVILKIMIEHPLKITLTPVINWLNDHGLPTEILSMIAVFILYLIMGSYAHRRIRLKMSNRSAVILGMMIILAIPLVWFALNLKGAGTASASSLLALMALTAIVAWISPAIPDGSTLLRSLFIAFPAISLGVALGTSGAVFAENISEHGTIVPSATVNVIDHVSIVDSKNGNYLLPAMTYWVVRDSNKIKIGFNGMPGEKSQYDVSKEVQIIFDGQSILPDGNESHFTLKGGKHYTLILE